MRAPGMTMFRLPVSESPAFDLHHPEYAALRHSAPDAPHDDVSRLGPEPGRGGPAAS